MENPRSSTDGTNKKLSLWEAAFVYFTKFPRSSSALISENALVGNSETIFVLDNHYYGETFSFFREFTRSLWISVDMSDMSFHQRTKVNSLFTYCCCTPATKESRCGHSRYTNLQNVEIPTSCYRLYINFSNSPALLPSFKQLPSGHLTEVSDFDLTDCGESCGVAEGEENKTEFMWYYLSL